MASFISIFIEYGKSHGAVEVDGDRLPTSWTAGVDTALVETLHHAALNPGEPPGRARDTSLAKALAWVENRLAYGRIEDVFDLAAMYEVAVAHGAPLQPRQE
jgi:hypothetical protein